MERLTERNTTYTVPYAVKLQQYENLEEEGLLLRLPEECNPDKILKVKDFKAGQKAYDVFLHKRYNRDPEILKAEVKSVGRKYVTLADSWESKYMENDECYLVEAKDWGERSYLFRTKNDAEEYLEHYKLSHWLGSIGMFNAESYSLEQLRLVKKILG